MKWSDFNNRFSFLNSSKRSVFSHCGLGRNKQAPCVGVLKPVEVSAVKILKFSNFYCRTISWIHETHCSVGRNKHLASVFQNRLKFWRCSTVCCLLYIVVVVAALGSCCWRDSCAAQQLPAAVPVLAQTPLATLLLLLCRDDARALDNAHLGQGS